MTNFKHIVTLLALVTFLAGCKKYEDGPGVSFRSAKQRVAGEWVVTEYRIGGNDMLAEYTSPPLTGYCNNWSSFTYQTKSRLEEMIFDFEKDGDLDARVTYVTTDLNQAASANACTPIYINETDSETVTGEWEFKDDKKELKLEIHDGANVDVARFEIKRLTNKEMVLEGFENGEIVVIELEAND